MAIFLLTDPWSSDSDLSDLSPVEDEYAKVDKSRRNEAPDLGDVTAPVTEEEKPVTTTAPVPPVAPAASVTQAPAAPPPAAAPAPAPAPAAVTAVTTTHTAHVTHTAHTAPPPTNNLQDTQ